MVFMGVILDEFGHDHEIKRTDQVNTFEIVVDTSHRTIGTITQIILMIWDSSCDLRKFLGPFLGHFLESQST